VRNELRFFFGPGFRAYYTIKDWKVVFLLCGGDKSTQARDINKARAILAELEKSLQGLVSKRRPEIRYRQKGDRGTRVQAGGYVELEFARVSATDPYSDVCSGASPGKTHNNRQPDAGKLCLFFACSFDAQVTRSDINAFK
jgi:hypothetical protein